MFLHSCQFVQFHTCATLLFQLQPNVPLPSPNALKNKILIKNKRLDSEKEKEEMEKFRTGKLNDDDGEKEDSAAPAPAVISLDKKVVGPTNVVMYHECIMLNMKDFSNNICASKQDLYYKKTENYSKNLIQLVFNLRATPNTKLESRL